MRTMPSLLITIMMLFLALPGTAVVTASPASATDDVFAFDDWRGGLVGMEGDIAILGTSRDTPDEDYTVIDAISGANHWSWTGNFGGLNDGRVYASTPAAIFMADAHTGDKLWSIILDEGVRWVSLGEPDASSLYAGGEISLIALDAATGAERWRIPNTLLGLRPESCDTIAARGEAANTILVSVQACGTPNFALVALDAATGGERWRTTITTIWGIDVIDIGSDQILVGTGSSYQAFDRVTGSLRWEVVAGLLINRTAGLAVLTEILSPGPSVTVVDEGNGDVRWSERGESVLDADEHDLLVRSEDGSLALRSLADGSEHWRTLPEVGHGVTRGSLDDEAVFVYAWGGRNQPTVARRLDRVTGAEAWQVSLEGTLHTGPLVSESIVVATVGDSLIALDAGTGTSLWGYSDGAPRYLEVITNGLVYVKLSESSTVVALELSTGTIAWRREA